MIAEKCSLCERPLVPDSLYCNFHKMASIEIKSRFSEWNIAFGNISWERYLETIIGLKEIGVWASEVARFDLLHFRQASASNQSFKDTGQMFHGN